MTEYLHEINVFSPKTLQKDVRSIHSYLTKLVRWLDDRKDIRYRHGPETIYIADYGQVYGTLQFMKEEDLLFFKLSFKEYYE